MAGGEAGGFDGGHVGVDVVGEELAELGEVLVALLALEEAFEGHLVGGAGHDDGVVLRARAEVQAVVAEGELDGAEVEVEWAGEV